MERSCRINGERGSCVLITVEEFERTDPECESDANWLACTVRLKLPNLTFGYATSFQTHDFVRLSRGLKSLIALEADVCEFTSTENQLELSFSKSATGRVLVSGKALDNQTTVSFDIESDLTYLPELASQVDEIVRHFPVRYLSG